jgi:hypothetical protein
VFTLGWFILGFFSQGYTLWGTRIAPYSAISQSISGLGLGSTAPYMNTIFVLTGTLMLVGAIGISHRQPAARSRRHVLVCLALPAFGAVVDGLFTLRFFFFHFLGFGLALTSIFGLPVVGAIMRKHARWTKLGSWLVAAGPLTLMLTILFFATFTPTVKGSEHGIAGLTERILVIEIMLWYGILGWRVFRGDVE